LIVHPCSTRAPQDPGVPESTRPSWSSRCQRDRDVDEVASPCSYTVRRCPQSDDLGFAIDSSRVAHKHRAGIIGTISEIQRPSVSRSHSIDCFMLNPGSLRQYSRSPTNLENSDLLSAAPGASRVARAKENGRSSCNTAFDFAATTKSRRRVFLLEASGQAGPRGRRRGQVARSRWAAIA